MADGATTGINQVEVARRILEKEVTHPKIKAFLGQSLENTVTLIRGLPYGIVTTLVDFVNSGEKEPFTYIPGDNGGMMLKGGTKLSNTHYGRAGRLYRSMDTLFELHKSDFDIAADFYKRINDQIGHEGVDVK